MLAAGKSSFESDRIRIIPLDATVTSQVLSAVRSQQFAETFGDTMPVGAVVGSGDVLDISIWEAPPAALFGSSISDSRGSSAAAAVSRSNAIPEQIVDQNGRIVVPFVGDIAAAGRTTKQIEREIVSRLTGKAHSPQAIVRIVRNANTNVTVIGEVGQSARIPLSPQGERLLDVLALAGGVRQPVGKTTIQVARRGQLVSMPLEGIIADPRQNIRLAPNDVVTASFQSFSFTALGATGANAEINFEATGISLAQALGRVGGLRDERADIRGVFIFRFEDVAAVPPQYLDNAPRLPGNKVPVIYQLDLANAANLFIAQNFPVRHKDILYVSNAPGADLQKFVGIASQMAFSLITIGNAAN
ncbi:polysaccharide export outer membrane protein [Novosphingobium hassiacum]|uniref:Polysaccharide export outer membrane protein n=1 Tax=Novosphingobium hassiacum TaxID=173676 RepID=A0A7W5ZUC7_9SPHN|nr:polysaccharide export outer membrane protein [Novosphingobium hassiacum]